MNCERCAKPQATSRCITVILHSTDGTNREEVHFDLCLHCYQLASQAQPVDLDQFLDYEPDERTIETHDYAYADHEREIVQQGAWY